MLSYQSTENAVDKTNSPTYPGNVNASDTNRGCLLSTFLLISTGTAITASICVVCLAIFMVISIPVGKAFSANSLIQLTIQLYHMVLLIAIILIEMEWSDAIRAMSILQSWGIRGLCYIFVGLTVFQEFGGLTSMACTTLYPYLKVPCIVLILFGLTYSIMGSLCLRKVRDTKMARYIQLLSHFEVQSVIRKNAVNSRSMVSIATSNDSELLL